jgi:hypothetical protein
MEFERDHGPLTEPMADRHARELAESAMRWEKELGIDFEKIAEEAARNPDVERPAIKFEHLELDERAKDLADDVLKWLDGRSSTDPNVREALEVISHFSFFVAAKIHRALQGLADDDGNRDFPPDFEGSAKIALIGLERMRAAFATIADVAYVSRESAMVFVNELTWLIAETEKAVPLARAFVRAGFDEPEALARLDASGSDGD